MHRSLAGAENQNYQRSDEEGIGRRSSEFIGIGKDREKRFAIRGDVGDDHVNEEGQRDQA